MLESWQAALAALLLGYGLGSVPYGILLTRLAGAGDLRSIGSGNIGATNVLRTGRKGLAAATLLLDMGKGFAAVWLAHALLPAAAPYAAMGAVLGHCFPVWLRFRGGKGVATTLGVALGLAWPVGIVFAVMWLGVLAATRTSSLGGLAAVLSAPAAAWAFGLVPETMALAAIAVLVVWLHRPNIVRLRAGTEPKIGQGE